MSTECPTLGRQDKVRIVQVVSIFKTLVEHVVSPWTRVVQLLSILLLGILSKWDVVKTFPDCLEVQVLLYFLT